MTEKKNDAGLAPVADVSRAIFRSVSSQEEFERLPRPTVADIQRALDEGRPHQGEVCAGTSLPRLDPTLRFF